MNWIEYAKEKPTAEPKRQVLCMSPNRVFHLFWSDEQFVMERDVTHWAEIEGPNPFKLPLEARVSVLEAKVLAICGCADNEQPIPSTPTPLPLDPFEVWWENGDRAELDWGNTKRMAKQAWDAAMKHKEGK